MAEGGEMHGFVWSITFIIVFSALLTSIPVGLQGQGGTADELLPVDPNLIANFSESVDFTRTDFTGTPLYYDYDLGGYKWRCYYQSQTFWLVRKVLIAGILWLGGVKNIEFVLDNGTNRGRYLTFTEIDSDDDDGTIRYDLQYLDTGNEAGKFIFSWNTSLYTDSEDAWDNDVLYLLHGIGLGVSATSNIGFLLISLLFLQLPDCPVLVNALIATPIWACILYVLWYVIKEMIPFV